MDHNINLRGCEIINVLTKKKQQSSATKLYSRFLHFSGISKSTSGTCVKGSQADTDLVEVVKSQEGSEPLT